VDNYLHRLGKFWAHLGFLLEFSAQYVFVRHRFLQDRMKMKAFYALAKRIVPVPSSHVCIAYGDWSNQGGIKGHPSAPVKGFARALRKRATVVPMDEYKTSKLCLQCHHTLEKARLLATNDDGEFELRKSRNVLRCANSACSQLLEPRRQRRPQHPRTARYQTDGSREDCCLCSRVNRVSMQRGWEGFRSVTTPPGNFDRSTSLR